MKFEWDEEKASINFKKHKVNFTDAVFIFQDNNMIEFYDTEHSTYEDRYVAIGLVGTVLYVVFTIRKDSIRIISARKANSIERRYYNDNNRN